MARKKKTKYEEGGIDLTSMIDVCFLLIAFFIMVTEVAKSEVVEIFLPFASHAEEEFDGNSKRTIVNIDREGSVWIRMREYGRPNDIKAKDDILRTLNLDAEDAGFDDKQDGNPSNLVVFIRADAHTTYKYIQCMMMLLIDEKVRVRKVHYVARSPNESS